MKQVYIISDFDGTLTNRVGFSTVSTPFYQSLLVNGGKPNYARDQLISDSQVQDKFKQEFGDHWPNSQYTGMLADSLIPEDTVKVLHQLLLMEGVNFRIISKNRADYIQALLRYQGFEEKEIAKIQFGGGQKDQEVMKQEIIPYQSTNPTPAEVWVLDDNKSDLRSMVQALNAKGYLSVYEDVFASEGNIEKSIDCTHIVYNSPGQFDWQGILESVKQSLRPDTLVQTDNEYTSGDETDLPGIVAEDEETPHLLFQSQTMDCVDEETDNKMSELFALPDSVVTSTSDAPNNANKHHLATRQEECKRLLLRLDSLTNSLANEYDREKQALIRIKGQLKSIQNRYLVPLDESQPSPFPVNLKEELTKTLLNEANNLDAHLSWGARIVNLVKSFLAVFFGPSESLSPLNQADKNSFFYPRVSEVRQQATDIVCEFGQTLK